MSLSKGSIRVLIVDDSSVVRKMISTILASDPAIEVVGVASDPYVAREKMIRLKPDVITLDVEMPRMDGVTFLAKIMKHMPTPVVMVSSLTPTGSKTAMRALELGAVSVIGKPAINLIEAMESVGDEIIANVKAAAKANLRAQTRIRSLSSASVPDYNASSLAQTTHQVLAIASSTGGTEALKVILPRLPANIPGTVIVQHIPPVFSRSFAERLNTLCPFEVREAQDGDRVLPGVALLAPGNFHVSLVRSGARYLVKLDQRPLLHGVRPAADFLFESVAKFAGANAIGLILTGMGKDGAKGLKMMRDKGSYNIAQDEATSVVFGMPKEAIDADAIDRVCPLENVARELLTQIKRREVA